MLNGVVAGNPLRYRFTSKQRGENLNQTLRSHYVLTELNNKRFVSHLEIVKRPLREERIVLHNNVYSANKV